jgi:hypothetical protein
VNEPEIVHTDVHIDAVHTALVHNTVEEPHSEGAVHMEEIVNTETDVHTPMEADDRNAYFRDYRRKNRAEAKAAPPEPVT